MGRIVNVPQNVFSQGFLSTRARGRRDNPVYSSSFRYSNNLIPLLQGSVRARSGNQFVLPVRNSAEDAIIVEFQFNDEQTYILQLGEGYARVYRDREPVKLPAQNITGATQANPVVLTVTGHGYSNGDIVFVSGVSGMTQINDRWFFVNNVTANTFELQDLFKDNVDGTSFDAYVSGGTVEKAFEITGLPWLASDLVSLTYTQSADVLFFFENGYQTRSLGRVSDTNWTLNIVEYKDGPYLPINATDTTITPSALTGSITLTASTSLFAASDVGRFMRIREGTNEWGYVEITGFTSSTVVSAQVFIELSSIVATDQWRFSVYGGSTYGYPRVGVIHEERFVVGGSQVFLDNVAFTQTALYTPTEFDFSPSELDGQVIDSNGLTVNLGSNQIDRVNWLSSTRALLVGTTSSEYSVTGSGVSSREAITPDRRVIQRESNYGSVPNVRVHLIGNSTLYTDKSGLKVREEIYDFGIDGFRSLPISVTADDILRPSVKRTAFQRNPDPIMWMVMGDGTVVGLTFEKENEVTGFHLHTFTREGEKVIDVGVISRPDAQADDVYFLVERNINGHTVKYLEFMTPMFEEISDLNEAFFVDCGISVTNSPASATVGGLWHLEGEEIDVLVDGSNHPKRTVQNGQVTLEYAAENVKAGFAYEKEIHLLPPEVPDFGSIGGRVIRFNKFYIDLVDTVGLQSTTNSANNYESIPFNGFNNNLNQAAPLFNGVLPVTPASGFAPDDFLQIRNTLPLPFGFNYVISQIEINN